MNTAQSQQQGNQALVVSGTFSDEKRINEQLDLASKTTILVSPATTCALRPGCSVSFNLVKIDGQTETYDVGMGKRSLSRTALLKLANAAGICWNSARSYRVDDGSDPYYVHWHAEGAWQALDGTILPVCGDLQMDLREGSDQVRKILESARDPTKAPTQLRDTRAKILEHAQSKAELRGIRKSLAIRSYTLEELATKPFVVARVVFDGHDEDPEIERENKRAIREQMLAGSRALFGAPIGGLPARDSTRPPRHAAPPPPVGSTADDPDSEPETPAVAAEDWGDDSPPPRRAAPVGGPYVPPAAAVASKPASQPPARPQNARPPSTPPAAASQQPMPYGGGQRAPVGTPTGRSGFVIPGGRTRGTPLEEADNKDLAYWAENARDPALRAAANAERDKRLGVDSGDQIPF